MTGGKKKYTLSKYFFKGTEYIIDLDETGNDRWETRFDGEEELDKLYYIQVDEYDEWGVWYNRERYMVDEWYKDQKPIPIIRRIFNNHPADRWEYKRIKG